MVMTMAAVVLLLQTHGSVAASGGTVQLCPLPGASSSFLSVQLGQRSGLGLAAPLSVAQTGLTVSNWILSAAAAKFAIQLRGVQLLAQGIDGFQGRLGDLHLLFERLFHLTHALLEYCLIVQPGLLQFLHQSNRLRAPRVRMLSDAQRSPLSLVQRLQARLHLPQRLRRLIAQRVCMLQC